MQPGREQILRYLDEHGVQAKDPGPHAGPPRKKISQSSRRGHARRVLDLHGLTEDSAVIRIREACSRCIQDGVGELLIIHGIGRHSDPALGPVLKRCVIRMLEEELSMQVSDWVAAPPRDGGDGATLLKMRLKR